MAELIDGKMISTLIKDECKEKDNICWKTR